MDRKDLVTHGEPIAWNDQHKHAARLEPAIAVLKEYQFHAAIVSIAAFKIVRWIEVQQRERFHRAVDVTCVAVNSARGDLASLFRSIRVKLDSVPQNQSVARDDGKRTPISDARVQRCILG